jgi:DNA-binding transcriptional regulator YhcF (GntR family)
MTFSEQLRVRIREHMGDCPICRRRGVLTLREVARQADVNISTLHRFMRGLPVESGFIDNVVAWWTKRHPLERVS